jgi:peroxiredoxin
VAVLYNMLMEGESPTMPVTVRSVFLISPEKKIMLTLTYPPSTGRNFDEILRVLDSLQITYQRQLATPVNWHKGERCVVPASLSNEQAMATFGNYETVKPYLRYVEADGGYPFSK